MLAFNTIYSLYLRSDEYRLKRKIARISHRVTVQIQRIETGQSVEEKHCYWMRRRLSRVNALLAFDRFLDERDGRDPAFSEYLQQLRPVFLYLAAVYQRREDTQAAYYCHFLSRHLSRGSVQTEELQSIIASYMEKKSLYCRLNTLKALCAFANAQTIVDTLLLLGSKPGTQLHEKLIAETLLTFTGDADDLIGLVWERFERFLPWIQRALLSYIRFQSGDYCEQMMDILLDSGRNKELRFEAIRYMGKYPFPPARKQLLKFVSDTDPLHWEYAAISASALARYEGQEVIEALSLAIHSSNWYVRYNAAASLETKGLTYEQLLDIAGDDRYSREMLIYHLESHERIEDKKEVPIGV